MLTRSLPWKPPHLRSFCLFSRPANMNATKNNDAERDYEAQADHRIFSHFGCVAGRNGNRQRAINAFLSVMRDLGRR